MQTKPYITTGIRKLSVIFLCSLLVSGLYGQRKTELGLFAGTSSYLGDLNPDRLFYTPRPSLGLLHIYNIHKRYALRNQLSYVSLSAPDKENIGTGFSSQLIDFSSRFEINFMPFKLADRKKTVSTYINGGLGGYLSVGSSEGSPVQFVLPFGVGIKAGLNRRTCLGLEFGVRKSFTDQIDHIRNRIYTTEVFPGNHFFINNDWYSVAGLFITYKIFDDPGDCPVYPE